ncbi:MAG: NADP-dependent oxidoreductase [Betaproteobacteria bacterium]
MQTYQRIVLAARPKGGVSPSDFRLETVPVPEVGDGQLLIRNHYLSLDPYMRMRMEDVKSYAAPQAIDEVMVGGTVGEVVASKHHKFSVGDQVVGMLGWSEMGLSDGTLLKKVDGARVPLSAYLGVVGMPGTTAWYGLNHILKLKAGQTLAVSAASGAVGSVVGQLAKLQGCRVIGIAGGKAKCDLVINDFGFDACVDYKAGNLFKDVKAAAPDGIDGLFENVGGVVMDACLAQMNPFGRVALCGLISGYDGQPMPIHALHKVLSMRLMVQGFIITEHLELWSQGLSELGQLVASQQLKYRETLSEGLASAPEAFIGLLRGKNVGKQLVKLI